VTDTTGGPPPPAVRRSRDPGHPWIATDPTGLEVGCESLSLARSVAGCAPIGAPPRPVPSGWFRSYLAATGFTAPAVAKILEHRDDRRARRWKSGEETPPWPVAVLLAAWADGQTPELMPYDT
jgi:hypothetical protein